MGVCLWRKQISRQSSKDSNATSAAKKTLVFATVDLRRSPPVRVEKAQEVVDLAIQFGDRNGGFGIGGDELRPAELFKDLRQGRRTRTASYSACRRECGRSPSGEH